MDDDAELLRRYAGEKSEASFAEFVRRRLDLVYAVALRKVGGDAHLARDVAQRVFVDVARKAASLARHPALEGWLFTSTHFAATQLVRSERRRRVREVEAHAMNEAAQSNADMAAANWEQLRPLLDDLVNELNERDRTAVLLRYFEARSLAEVGARLQLSEEGARSRVDRAVGKLRAALARRGVTSSAAALGIALANQVGVAAPAGLAASVTGAALANGVVGSSSVGIAWLAFFAMNKIKVGIVVAALLVALTPVALELQARQTLRTELALQQAGAVKVRSENAGLLTALSEVAGTEAMPNEAGELARWRKRAALLRSRPEGVVESEMRPPRNVGRATPEAAFETTNWAWATNDWALLAQTWTLTGETKTIADAFFAGLSPAARQIYGTPEKALAHGLLAASVPHGSGWMTAMQVYETEIVDGPGSVRVRLWQRQDSGKEFANEAIFERGPGGWVGAEAASARTVKYLVSTVLDPLTGEPRPKQK